MSFRGCVGAESKGTAVVSLLVGRGGSPGGSCTPHYWTQPLRRCTVWRILWLLGLGLYQRWGLFTPAPIGRLSTTLQTFTKRRFLSQLLLRLLQRIR